MKPGQDTPEQDALAMGQEDADAVPAGEAPDPAAAPRAKKQKSGGEDLGALQEALQKSQGLLQRLVTSQETAPFLFQA
jgi:peptidoglycan hydrolase-like protein with peptidoglycan-binding domain